MKKVKKFLGSFFGLVSFSLLINSCLDSEEIEYVDENVGWVALFNASPGSSSLQFFGNETSINNGGIAFNGFYSYVPLTAGNYDFTVQAESSENLDTLNLNLPLNSTYSIFAVNEFENLELIAYQDNLISSTSGGAIIRYIQLAPDVPMVIAKIDDQSLGTFAYKQASSFIEVPGGPNKTFYLINNETSDTIFSKQIDINPGSTYSNFTSGLLETTNESLAIDLQMIPYQ